MKEVSPLIEVNNLKVIYNKGRSNEVRSLNGVSVEIYPQEYVVFFGPSGCGKSTLLYSISGLQAPTEGYVSIEGKKIHEMSKKEMVSLHQLKIGMIFQAFYLIPSLNILDNICLPRVFCGESKSKRRAEGIRLLQRFSIVEQANKLPSQLSGGQKQRSSIARSLINNPEIILADEPVGNLDSESAENVLQILKDLNEVDKKTVILVTHNAEHLHYADRVIYIKDGEIVKVEVNKDKGVEYVYAKKDDVRPEAEVVSEDLKILMKTFKNMSPEQVGALLVPFKTNQIFNHVISDLNEEQINVANAFLREYLYDNIDLETLEKNLDLDYEKGGAGWNKHRAQSFAKRVGEILKQSRMLREKSESEGADSVMDYLINNFSLFLDEEIKLRLNSLIRQRIQNKIDYQELKNKLDASKLRGGVGLRKGTAEKVAKEVEIIMLAKYSD